MDCRTGTERSKEALSPPTMMARVPFSAPTTPADHGLGTCLRRWHDLVDGNVDLPPDTGASSMSAPAFLSSRATAPLTLCSMVDWSMQRVAERWSLLSVWRALKTLFSPSTYTSRTCLPVGIMLMIVDACLATSHGAVRGISHVSIMS